MDKSTRTILIEGKQYQVEKTDYFGVCPYCHDYDYYLNVGKAHWFVCNKHRVKWLAGMNLFSGWRDETEEEWEKNHKKIKDYEEVEPLPP